MFRFFFVLALAFFLSSFAISQKKSPNEVSFNVVLLLCVYFLSIRTIWDASCFNLIFCDLSLFSVWRLKTCQRVWKYLLTKIHKFTKCFLINYDRLMGPKLNKTSGQLRLKLSVARMVSKTSLINYQKWNSLVSKGIRIFDWCWFNLTAFFYSILQAKTEKMDKTVSF